ncbi:hypothetical protein D3C79_826690 [compost metagenome]
MNVVIADAGLSIGLVSNKCRTGVIGVVIPGHVPVAVGRRLGQRCGATGTLDTEIHRDSLGLVVCLGGQPFPGLGGTWADTGNQGRRALQLLQGMVQGGVLQGAIGGRQDHLDHLRLTALAQVQQLLVGQRLILQHGNGYPCFGVGARGHPGQAAAIVQGQVFQARLRCGAGPQPEAQGPSQ